MQNVIRWMLGGLVVFSLAACGPANGDGDDEDGTAVEQREDGDGDEEDD